MPILVGITIIMTITTTIMTDQNTALLRLMAWLSPVFPVGSFSYSNGLERAVHDDLVTDVESLQAWLQSLVIYGSGWNDAVLFAESWRQAVSGGDLSEVTELAAALAGSRERYMETMLQGAAFLIAAKSWDHAVFERLPSECAYPLQWGCRWCAWHSIDISVERLSSGLLHQSSAGIHPPVCHRAEWRDCLDGCVGNNSHNNGCACGSLYTG